MDDNFHGIDDRIFNVKIYGIEDEVDHEQNHPSIKGEDE